MTKRRSDVNQHDALYTIACEYPGGVEALAFRMGGKNAKVLRSKLDPDIKSHYPSFEEVSVIIEKCSGAKVENALLPLHAMNWRHGLIAFPVPQVTDLSDEELTKSICKVMKEISEATAEATKALCNDGIRKRDALEKIEKEFQEALAATAELRHRLQMRYEQDLLCS